VLDELAVVSSRKCSRARTIDRPDDGLQEAGDPQKF